MKQIQHRYLYPPLAQRKAISPFSLQPNCTYSLRSVRISKAQHAAYQRGMKHYGISNNVFAVKEAAALSLNKIAGSVPGNHVKEAAALSLNKIAGSVPGNHVEEAAALSLSDKIQRKQKSSYDTCVVDIGFGNGKTLYNFAAQYPEILFIGIEVYKSGLGTLIQKLESASLSNILLYHDDALRVLLHEIDDESIDCFQFFFPDPWHKKKHNKRRLLNRQTLLLLYQLLKPESGTLWFISDNKEYAQDLEGQLLDINANYAATHGICWNMHAQLERANVRSTTKFEQRALKSQSNINSLIVQRSA